MTGSVIPRLSVGQDLLEKLQKYKETKQQKKEQERAFTQSKKPVRKSQNVPERRATLGCRQPSIKPQTDHDRRKTINHRPSPRQLGRRRSLGGKRPPLVETKQITHSRSKSTVGSVKKNQPKSATIKRKLSPSDNRNVPVRKRSFTITPEKVSSPGLKRPIIQVLDSDRTCSAAKRRRTAIKPAVPKPSVPCPRKSQKDSAPASQISMKDQLLLWRQSKAPGPVASTKVSVGRASHTSHHVASTVASKPNTARVPSVKPASVSTNHANNKAVRPPKDASSSAMTAAERRKAYAAQLRSKSEIRAPTKKPNVVSRSMSCAPPKTAQTHRRSVTSVEGKVKAAEQHKSRDSLTIPGDSVSRTSRRKSCAPLSAASKKTEALNRRKSYAMSLQSYVKSAPERHKQSKKHVNTNSGAKSTKQNSASSKSGTNLAPSAMEPESHKPDTERPTPGPSKQVAVVCPQTHSPQTQAELDKVDYSPTLVFSPVPFKTPRDKARRSVRFLTPQSEARLACAKTPGTGSRAPGSPSAQTRMTPLQKEKSMRDKLDNWLTTHGKTPTRYKHLLRFGDFCEDTVKLRNKPGGLSIRQLARQIDAIEIEQKTLEDETCTEISDDSLDGDHSLVICERSLAEDSLLGDPVSERLEEILSECIILLESACPVDTVSQWLTQICDNLEGAKQRAKYWICLAKIAQQTGNDSSVISVFEESVRHNAQPPEEVADALKEFVEEMSARSYVHRHPEVSNCTPCKRPRDVQEENMLASSTIKYCFTETTPFFSRLHSKARRSYCTPHSKVTPVRRSTRLSANTGLPEMLRDHDLVVESLDSLTEEQRHTTLYTPNRALTAELEAALDDSY